MKKIKLVLKTMLAITVATIIVLALFVGLPLLFAQEKASFTIGLGYSISGIISTIVLYLMIQNLTKKTALS